MRKHTSSSHHLELRVHELAQLFNSMDPTPFHSKALDREAETSLKPGRVVSPRITPYFTFSICRLRATRQSS